MKPQLLASIHNLSNAIDNTLWVADVAFQDARAAADPSPETVRLTQVLGCLRSMACTTAVALSLLEELPPMKTELSLNVLSDLSAPFTAAELKFKPGVVSGNRALALPYVDARSIMDRLDAVVGVDGWRDDYECLTDGSVVCRLSLRLNGEWVTKVDVGGQSEQPDEGDRRKAAFSDALKRAAVKFGMGRYLYRAEPTWVDYDPKRKRIVSAPLPEPPAPRPAPRLAAKPQAQAQAQAQARPEKTLPASGAELERRLQAYEAQLVAAGTCRQGELLEAVRAAGEGAGYGAELSKWSKGAIEGAAGQVRKFENARKNKRKDVA